MKRTIITWVATILLVSAAIVWAGWKATYTELAETPATDDFFIMVDLSDTTMDATGTTKWISFDNMGIPDLVTLSGMPANSENLGAFTGTTITSNSTIKTALQELETYAETKIGAANPTFTGTVVLPGATTLPTTGVIRPATTTDADYFALSAYTTGGVLQDVVRIVNDTGGTPEFQLQAGAALTGLGALTIETAGIIRNETDTSTDYFRIQATDDVGDTPVQTDVIKVTNSGDAAAAKVEIGNTLTATKVYLTATADTMANLDWNGTAIVGKACGEGITAPAVVYLNSAGKWMMADADEAAHWPARGIAVVDCVDTGAGTVLVNGILRYDTWAWTIGEILYLDDVHGAVINAAGIPATAGDCVQAIGWALSDDEAYFNFTAHYLEIE